MEKQPPQSETDFQSAAVLVPFFSKNGEMHVLLTKRSTMVTHHKGQISFPGGSREPLDDNLWQTALRETHEELGIAGHQIMYVTDLPIVDSPSLFQITPFVGFLPFDFEINCDENEVDHAFSVPVSHLADPKNVRFEERKYFGKTYEVPFFTYRQYEIWGVTGRILTACLDLWT